jgi:hypothetical protein
MLKKIPGRESLRHICDNISEQGIKGQEFEVYLHDLQAAVVVKNTRALWKSTGASANIKFCPYCGVEVEKEERP